MRSTKQIQVSLEFQDKFTFDKSVIRSEVLKSTGERPGRVNVNGRDIDVSGQMVTSLWAKNGAPTTHIPLCHWGSDSDYQSAWAAILGNRWNKISTEIIRTIVDNQ